MADSSLMNARVNFFLAVIFVLLSCLRPALCDDENTQGILSIKQLMQRAEPRKEYVVGLTRNHRLFSSFSGVYGKYDGFAVRAMDSICDELRIICKIKYVPYSDLEHLIMSGEVDFAAGFYVSGRYGMNLKRTTPLIKARPVLVSLDSNIAFATTDELSSLNIGVHFATGEYKALEEAREIKKIAYYSVYGNYDDMFDALKKGKVDALFLDNLTAYGMMVQSSDVFYMAPDRLKFYKSGQSDEFTILTAENGRLLQMLNGAVSKLRRAGTFSSTMLNFFPFSTEGL